jgi:hypothetical protein
MSDPADPVVELESDCRRIMALAGKKYSQMWNSQVFFAIIDAVVMFEYKFEISLKKYPRFQHI